MPIRKLSPLLVNQIAAGEVIERPASVVKELVENSLDAGATMIQVLVEEGGRQLIRVSDDGLGIAPDELPLALAAHATSKLQNAEQLASIATMGFRGEALASIASVSRLRLVSRATIEGQPLQAGAMIQAQGDEVEPIQPCAASPGTIVEVRDLFFNTPARQKFLRSASTEFGHIAELISRLAMAHPGLGFQLTHNSRVSLEVPPGQTARQRCVQVLGKELDEALLEFENQHDGPEGPTRVWGLAGQPAIARATAKFQYLYINDRPIRDRNLAHAVKEAYRGLIAPDLNPVVVLFIQMPPSQVDVNVHPAKSEVRLNEPNRMHGLVLAAIRQRLLGTDLTPQANMKSAAARWLPEAGGDGPSLSGSTATPPSALSTQAFVDYFKRMAPQQQGLVYEQVKQTLAQENPSLMDNLPSSASPSVSVSQATPPVQPIRILQVHQSYVVTQDEQGMLIIDQHALHERVMFEQLRQRVLGANQALESQRLLMPAIMNLTPQRLALLEELKPLLQRLGIEAEPIGPSAAGVQAFPSFLFDRRVEPVEFLNQLLDLAQDGQLVDQAPRSGKAGTPSLSQETLLSEAVLHKVLDMMSCKAAIKAGDSLTQQELESLLAQRDQIERSSSCPHGRPTTLRLTLSDLEKQFKRS